MLSKIIPLILLVCAFCGNTQPLERGQELPLIVSSTVLNYPENKISLADFKGKPFILDYWSFNCASCIRDFPKLEDIQKKLDSDAQIILVNSEGKEQTEQFFEKFSKSFKMPKLPMITGDSIIRKLFPPNYMPWQIWVDKKGVFKHITDTFDDASLQDFANGKRPDVIEIIPQAGFLREAPIFTQPDKKYLSLIDFYSYISRSLYGTLGEYVEVGNIYQGEERNGKSIRLTASYRTIPQLFAFAFGENNQAFNFYSKNNVILEVKDSSRLIMPHKRSSNYEEWCLQNIYNYDCMVPAQRKNEMFKMMQDDLVRVFNLKVSIEKRMVKSWALIRTSNEDKLKTKGEIGNYEINAFILWNTPMRQFVWYLQNNVFNEAFQIPEPISDETGYAGNIDIQLRPGVQLNRENIVEHYRKELLKYDLDLVLRDALQDVLVIRDN